MQPTRKNRMDNPLPNFGISAAWSCSRWGLPIFQFTKKAGDNSPFHPFLHKAGGLISVALSVASQRLAVSEHPVLLEFGLSSSAE